MFHKNRTFKVLNYLFLLVVLSAGQLIAPNNNALALENHTLLPSVSALSDNSFTSSKPDFVADVIILEVRQGVSLVADEKGMADHKFKTDSSELNAVLASLGVNKLKPIFPPVQARKAEATNGSTPPLRRYIV